MGFVKVVFKKSLFLYGSFWCGKKVKKLFANPAAKIQSLIVGATQYHSFQRIKNSLVIIAV